MGVQTLLLIGLLLDVPDLIIRAQGLEVVVAVDVVDGRDELLGQLVDSVLKLGESVAHLNSKLMPKRAAPLSYPRGSSAGGGPRAVGG